MATELEFIYSLLVEERKKNEYLRIKINNLNEVIKILRERIEGLEEGIKKHKLTPYIMGCLVIASKAKERDEELYKLIKEE